MEFSIETITPERALGILEENNSHNRKLKNSLVDRLASDMKRDEWVMNGEAIKFGSSGRLLDGQHRLNAIAKSGVTLDLAVMRNIDESTMTTLDTGASRSASDVISIDGVFNANDAKNIAVMARLIMAHDLGSGSWGRGGAGSNRKDLTNKDILKFVKINEHQISDAILFAIDKVPYRGAVFQKAQAAAIYYLMKRASYSEDCFEFLSQICSGVGIEQNSMAEAVRGKLISVLTKASKMAPMNRVYMVAKCVNSINAGRGITHASNMVYRQSVDSLPFIGRK